jgi:hypothetical protein
MGSVLPSLGKGNRLKRTTWIFLTLLALAFLQNVYIISRHPVRLARGDEAQYIEIAHQDSSRSVAWSRLVPGFMVFEWQPPFVNSLYGLLRDPELLEAYRTGDGLVNPHQEWSQDLSDFFLRVSVLNLVLYLAAGANLYFLTGKLGFGGWAAALASGLYFFNPRVVFYVQSLWPEILHIFLLSSGFTVLVIAIRNPQRRWYFFSGVIIGFAALTKGVLGVFLWLLLPAIAWSMVKQGKMDLQRTVRCLGLFVLGYALVLTPQVTANRINHGVTAIATNTWINIEAGLIPASETDGDFFNRYFSASEDPVTREVLSRARVFEYLRRTNPLILARFLAERFVDLQLDRSFLENAYNQGRWGPDFSSPARDLLISLSVVFSRVLFLLGAIGALSLGFRSPERVVLACFVWLYLGMTFIVGFHPRNFIQVFPYLAVFTAAAVNRMVIFVRNRSALAEPEPKPEDESSSDREDQANLR